MKIGLAVAFFLGAGAASAGVCDYKPSAWVGDTVADTAIGGAAATAGAGVALKTAGVYAITNATTGAAMLGSTTAGASAAGTTGIIAGSSGVIGTIGGVLLAPEVLLGAAAVALVGGGYEGACWLVE